MHADSVYAVAQAFTLNSLRASRLVEAVFRRAGEAVPPEIGGEKEWLLSLLRDELEAEDQAAGSTDGSASTDLRRRLATKALQRLIPAAFASFDPSDERL
ncbi:MAG: hypothetical protein ACOCTG_01750, partial [Bacteroidota bacterium]